MTLPNSDPNQVQGSGQPDPALLNQTAGVNQNTGAGGAGSGPSPEAQEWEKKYKGLQTAYNKLDIEKKKTMDDLNSALGTIEEQNVTLAKLQQQVAELTTSVGAKDTEAKTAQTEATTKGLEVTRLKLIVKEFPQLAEFESKSVLPEGTSEEDLRTKFTNFAAALKITVGASVESKLKGAGIPSSSEKPASRSSDDLYNEMALIAGNPLKRVEFLKLRDEYDRALALESNAP